MIRVSLYLFSIVLANVITAAFMPIQIGIFLVPMGVFFAGATFIFRDLVQNKYGRGKTYIFIITALILSAVLSGLLGDTLMVVVASAIAFIIAEVIDTEIYTRWKVSIPKRVFYSGTFGGLFDSIIFVVIGLSPIGAGFVPWAAVPAAILGQVIAKTIIQLIGAIILNQVYITREKRLAVEQTVSN